MIKNRFLVASVFICGAAVMIFELTGTRIMAPYFGGSIYVWTSVIGVIMGSLALGYWLGGKLADKKTDAETYSYLLLASGAAIFWTFVIKGGVLGFFENFGLLGRFDSLLAALCLFFPANVLLGIISPYAVRLKILSLEKSASVVGNLYAISTIGSIVGTFAAGYFLIPFFGTDSILLILFVILVIISRLFSKSSSTLKVVLLVIFTGSYFLLSAAKRQNALAADGVTLETQYNSIKIYPGADPATGKEILNMSFDLRNPQASMFLGSGDLVWDYTKFYRLAGHFVPGFKKALMIGGGAYSYPKDYLNEYSSAAMDVVEIDPGVTAAAKKYFRVPNDPRLVAVNEDARAFLNQTKNKYDVIFDDAFTSALMVPFQLTTQTSVERQYDALNDGGAVLANAVGSLDGPNGRFFRAEYATFKSVFPQVYVFPVSFPNDASKFQNLMIVAIKSPKPVVMSDVGPELNGYLQHEWKQPIAADMPVLTDDYAPVEYYMKSAF